MSANVQMCKCANVINECRCADANENASVQMWSMRANVINLLQHECSHACPIQSPVAKSLSTIRFHSTMGDFLFFRKKTHFLPLRGVCHKCLFYEKDYFHERIKLRLASSVRNTPFTLLHFCRPWHVSSF